MRHSQVAANLVDRFVHEYTCFLRLRKPTSETVASATSRTMVLSLNSEIVFKPPTVIEWVLCGYVMDRKKWVELLARTKDVGDVLPLSIRTTGKPLIRLLANVIEVEPMVPLGPLAVKLISFLRESNCRFDIVELLEI